MRSAMEKVSSVPGVASVAIASNGPLGGGFLQTMFRQGVPVDSRLGVLVLTVSVSSGYFDTMRIPLLEGRPIDSFDRAGRSASPSFPGHGASHVARPTGARKAVSFTNRRSGYVGSDRRDKEYDCFPGR